MFVRFTKAMRLRAGWLLALVYLLCVLAPAASFALPGGAKLAPCLTDDDHEFGIVHVHEHAASAARYVHNDDYVHKHTSDHAHAGKSAASASALALDDDKHSPTGGHHKIVGGQCCGMACLSALPATVMEVVKPSAPTSLCSAENYPNVADNTPARHYRPPIL